MSAPVLGACVVALGALSLCAGCGEDIITGSICQPTGGFVSRILDGDTIELDTEEKIRYLLVDTPEIDTNECFAEEARELNRSLVIGREVALEYDQGQCVGSLGRAIAYVYVDNRLVNQILVERGYGAVKIVRPDNHPEKYLREDEFLELEKTAQEMKKGKWGVCP